jgi:hypothetical protein
MIAVSIGPEKRARDLGLFIALCFTLIGGGLLLSGDVSCLYPLSVALAFLLAACFAPHALAPLEAAQRNFAKSRSALKILVIVPLSFLLLSRQ